MTDLTEHQKREYFHRSYTAADGLWFMKVEEKYGFLAALEIDEAVWNVLPKIQARTIKSMLALDNGLDGLQAAISTRLDLEGFLFDLERQRDSFTVFVKRCPWRDLMVESGREEFSQRICNIICTLENSVWATEFSKDDDKIGFEQTEKISDGACRCILQFAKI